MSGDGPSAKRIGRNTPGLKLRETVARLASDELGNERNIWMLEPRKPTTARTLTVFLDAELYRDHLGAVPLLEKIRDGLADSWFVFVSMQSQEARWRECPCYPPFTRFIADELLPWLERREKRLEKARRKVLIGLSYTGLAAAYVVKERPGVFDTVIAQSGSFWWNDCRLIDEYDRLAKPLPTRFHLDVGSRETDVDTEHGDGVFQGVSQVEAVRRFRDVLRRRGHRVRYAEFKGGHEFSGWRRTLPGALKWALPKSNRDGS